MMKRGTKHQIIGSGGTAPSSVGTFKSSKANKNAANSSLHLIDDGNQYQMILNSMPDEPVAYDVFHREDPIRKSYPKSL